MTATIIITLCSLLLLAYFFDISSPLTKIPSVILLLLLGWLVRQIVLFFQFEVPDLNPLLPALGTIGLILIVLEGSLELELNSSKVSLIKKALLNVFISILFLSFILAFLSKQILNVPFKIALLNIIPLCVISSAIAIPSVRNLSPFNKEFVTYESSLSDIIGVLFFNFIAINEIVTINSFGVFALDILLIILISFISVLGLSFLLSRIKHHITYTPIILIVILIYFISKIFHLPGLIFILVFGLFLGNLEELKRFKWIDKLRPEKLDKEVSKFKEITLEATFLIRALFFLLFGFLMKAEEILNINTLPWSLAIVSLIFLIRRYVLKATNLSLTPLVYVAPRGLITILLFLSIPSELKLAAINSSLIIQTIILSVLFMMFGLILNKN